MAVLWTVLVDWALNNKFGYQSANLIKNNIVAIASARLRGTLGGSRQVSVPKVAAAQDAIDYHDVEIDGTGLGGLSVRARVEVRTDNAATGVIPKIRNMTDSTDAVVGVSSTSTTWGGTNSYQTLTFTPTTGIKKYRLQATPANATNPVYVIGDIEIFATS
jgi:hypothetical protein